MKSRLLACAVLFTGCFDEGGNTAQTEAAITVAEAFVAFPELTANLTSGSIDAAAAANSLTTFIKMPVAANNLLEQPFDLAGVSGVARVAATPADLPGCVATSGPSGCDDFQAGMCEGGGFTFNGSARRRCTPATCVQDPPESDVLGECTYTWNMDLGFSNPDLGVTMSMNTSGTETVAQADVRADLYFGPYSLTNGDSSQSGNVRVCACGVANVAELPQGLRLVNSSFVVKDFATGEPQRCALVEFNGNGDPTSTVEQPAACVCADGVTCAGDGEPILF